MDTKHKVIIGDSRMMREAPDEYVHLIVTSPPYWQLKDYGNEKQIGFNDTYNDIELTNCIVTACKVIDVKILDHIIIGKNVEDFIVL